MLTLSTARARVQSLLMDSGVTIWPEDILDEGLRQALGDIGRACGSAVELAGLDGSPIEEPPPGYVARYIDSRDYDLLIRGAGGYAARSRAVDRAEMVSIVAGQPGGLEEWGKRELEDFQEGVEQVRKRGLQSARSGPMGAWGWDESHKGW
jgi:hypothetical protein